jgi:hypothetical protein
VSQGLGCLPPAGLEACASTRDPAGAGKDKCPLPNRFNRSGLRAHQKEFLLLEVMDRVAGEAVRMSLRVSLPGIVLVAAATTLKDGGRGRPGISPDLTGITSGLYMVCTRPVAAFATTARRLLSLRSLSVHRVREALIRVLVAALADFRFDVLGRIPGILWRLLANDTQAIKPNHGCQQWRKPPAETACETGRSRECKSRFHERRQPGMRHEDPAKIEVAMPSPGFGACGPTQPTSRARRRYEGPG